jgi:O-antigen ligase
MGSKWFLSLLITCFLILLSRFLPGPKDWWGSVGKKPFLSGVVIIAVVAVFLGGAREAITTVRNPVDTIRFIRILVIVALTVTAAIVILFSRGRASSGWAVRWMGLYAGVAMISCLYSSFPLLSLWKGFEVLSAVAVGILIGGFLHQREDIEHLINIVLLIIWFLVLSSLVGMIISPSLAFARMKQGGLMGFALQGVYPQINANTLSQISAMLASCSLCWVLGGQKRYESLGPLFVFVLALACVVLGHSRTSLFAFVLLVCFILIFFRAKITALATLWIGIMLGASGVAIHYITQYIFRGQSEELFTSLSGRTQLWPLVLEKIWQSPLVGHGFYSSQRMTWGLSTVDNTYLEVLLGVGIVGLTFFCMAVISVFVDLWRGNPSNFRLKPDSKWRLIWIQQVAMFLFLFFRSLTGPSFEMLHPSLTIFVIFAVSSSATLRIQRAEHALSEYEER